MGKQILFELSFFVFSKQNILRLFAMIQANSICDFQKKNLLSLLHSKQEKQQREL
jgi:hypothetical protein